MRSILTLPLLLLVACSGMGKLPGVVIEMYDRAKPDGTIEIEAERSGAIVEIEADILISDVPKSIRDAAMKELPGGQITGAEYEVVGKSRTYEVKMRKGGVNYEYVYDKDANMLESEKEIRVQDTPKGVVEAAIASIPGSKFKSVEIITKDGKDVYHVKSTRKGGTYKVIVSPEAKVLRRVREQRAEIEIPLAD
ncbi:MAG: hypothetical protein ACYS0E_14025 [Planctomycetota bacterium]|jgi:uncharacterized membrane protein YkoI